MFRVSIIGMFVNKEVTSNDTIIISDVVGKRDRIFGVVVFISNISFKNVSKLGI